MDLKEPGNLLYQVGATKDELGGSHYSLIAGATGGAVPQVDAATAKRTFAALHRAIDAGLVWACHDLSEGGLAVAVAEMVFAGNRGARLESNKAPSSQRLDPTTLLFSESNSRFLVEVPSDSAAEFERTLQGVPLGRIGKVTDERNLVVLGPAGESLLDLPIDTLKQAWQKPLSR
jgi:phosphoribosylformylglycinamidine synthase